MEKKLLKFSVSFLALLALFSFSIKAFAITPTLSLTPTGDGDSVQLNITGDANTSVLLSYVKSGYGQQFPSIGTTNANGTLTTTISTSTYGISTNSSVSVMLGSINGPQSNVVTWPLVSATISSGNMISLNQTGLVLSVGQSATVTASNAGSGTLYLSSNSSPAIANFSISGTQITVTANGYGSTVGTLCLTSNSSNCSSIYVNVQSGSAQPLTFSQNSISLSSGQTVSVQILGGSGSYLVLNNGSQNQGSVQTNISGSNITLTTTSTTGSSSITVCSTNMSSCGIINVTIGNVSSSAVSFSQSNPTVTVGQSINVSIYGPSGSLFYVSSNSNPSTVQANLSGATLTLLGITNGSTVINVCAGTNNCASLTVTVSYDSTNAGRLTLSQDNVNLSIGQTTSVTISGGSMPYNILSNGNSIFQSTLNNNVLSLVGVSSGSSLMNICSAAGTCVTLSINVNGANYTPTLPTGCSSISGYSQITGQLCSSTQVAPVNNVPSDCTGALYSISTGQACPVNTINTTPVIPPAPVVTTPAPTVTASTTFQFTKTIKLGSTGAEVIELQKKLKTLGFYTGKADGGYGPMTEKAVKAFQKAHKLQQVGSVGPLTRTALNK